MLDALDHLVSQLGTTRKQQRERRLSALRYLRRQLAVWLGPLIEWRDDLEQKPDLMLKNCRWIALKGDC